MAIRNTHHSIHIPAGAQVEEQTPLSEQEKQAHKLLSKTNPDTIWGAGIHNALGKRSNRIFRELIRQLKSQASDCPPVMIDIIGEEGYAVLMEL